MCEWRWGRRCLGFGWAGTGERWFFWASQPSFFRPPAIRSAFVFATSGASLPHGLYALGIVECNDLAAADFFYATLFSSAAGGSRIYYPMAPVCAVGIRAVPRPVVAAIAGALCGGFYYIDEES